MPSPYKLALLVITTPPVLYYALKYPLLGAYRGLVKRSIPVGEKVISGAGAVAIGLYSVAISALAIFLIGYLFVWLVP